MLAFEEGKKSESYDKLRSVQYIHDNRTLTCFDACVYASVVGQRKHNVERERTKKSDEDNQPFVNNITHYYYRDLTFLYI